MKDLNSQSQNYGKYLGMTIGVVKNNADPMQNGRLQIYVPSYDAIDFKIEDLPWAIYVSPFGGVTANYKVGPDGESLPGISAYGMWAIPKNGAQVLIGCLDGNPEARYYVGCIFMPEHNRTLPTGINGIQSDIDESGAYPQKDFPHMTSRLDEAGLGKTSKHFKTRGGYERSISHPSNKNINKPSDNGYAKKKLEPEKSDSQIHSFTTPGRHSLIMSDVDDHCRMRIKTTNGNQIIFDDTNERIYISTGKGKNWIELDEGNGKIYLYSDSKINIRAKNDLNLTSDENINIVAKKRVHIRSEERSIHLSSKYDITGKSSEADIIFNASRSIKLKTFDGLKASPISEKLTVKKPLDKIYNWEEKGGSDESSIELDSAKTIKSVSRDETILNSGNSMNIKGSDVKLQGGSIHFQFGSANWNPGISTGLVDSHFKTVKAISSASSALTYTGHLAITFPNGGDLPKMSGHPGAPIKPDHESWERDEDLQWSPNSPRNSKYIG